MRLHPSVQKGLLFVLFVAVVGGLGLGFCSLAYKNGVDLLKDGGLVSLVSVTTAAFMKFMGGSQS